jgi:hypothetical protein
MVTAGDRVSCELSASFELGLLRTMTIISLQQSGPLIKHFRARYRTLQSVTGQPVNPSLHKLTASRRLNNLVVEKL